MGCADPNIRAPDDDTPQVGTGPHPDACERSLDRIAAALDVTTSILSRCIGSVPVDRTGPAGLLEAAALVQAFVRIADPAIRRRCMAIVEAEARAASGAG